MKLTTIEICIVAAIVVLLGAIAFPNIMRFQERAKAAPPEQIENGPIKLVSKQVIDHIRIRVFEDANGRRYLVVGDGGNGGYTITLMP